MRFGESFGRKEGEKNSKTFIEIWLKGGKKGRK